jgi:AcrR family transcriptional regulator
MAHNPDSARRHMRSDAHRNRERLARAAIAAIHREGLAVPMATIASDAGVGVGTLYRHFATREELLDELTFRSFVRMIDHLTHASENATTGSEAFRHFLAAVIRDRSDMLLPTTGGPAVQTVRTRAAQNALHAAIEQQIERGAVDGTIRRQVRVWDIAWVGATLAQPGRTDPAWEVVCLRLLDTYIAGLSVP